MYKILIVDDNYMQLQSLLHYMEKINDESFEIKISQEAEEALKIAKEFEPDVIITDIVMPVMDGPTFSREVEKILPNVKIIYVSCYDEFDYVKDALDNNVVSYILKPIKPEDLKNSVDKAIQKIEEEKEFRSIGRLLEESMETYRKNFFYRLIYSQHIEKSYFNATLHALKIDEYSNFMIAKIEIVKDIPRMIDVYNLLNLTEKKLQGTLSAIAVVEGEKKIAVLYMGKGDAGTVSDKVKDTLCTYRSLVKNEYHLELDIGISAVHDNLQTVITMLREAESALENNLSFRDDGLYEFDLTDNTLWAEIDVSGMKNALSEVIDSATPDVLKNYVEIWCPKNVALSKYNLFNFIISLSAALQMIMVERGMEYSEVAEQALLKLKEDVLSIEANRFRERIEETLSEVINNINQKEETKQSILVKDIIDYIDKEFSSISSLRQVEERFYISGSYVRKIFKDTTGKTIFGYLLEKRMAEAERLLKHTDMRIYEIAEAVGYNGKTSFLEAFKKHKGISPAEYRKNKGKL